MTGRRKRTIAIITLMLWSLFDCFFLLYCFRGLLVGPCFYHSSLFCLNNVEFYVYPLSIDLLRRLSLCLRGLSESSEVGGTE